MRYIKGDLIDLYIKDEIDVLIHQINCQGVWGAGLAKQIIKAFPEAAEMDMLTKKGDPKKLGQFSFGFTDRAATKVIISLYSQQFYGRKPSVCYTDYKALLQALENARDWLVKAGLGQSRVGIPKNLGSGLAGGNWERVESLIGWAFYKTDFDVAIVEWDKNICPK